MIVLEIVMKLKFFLKLPFFLSVLFLVAACSSTGDEAVEAPPEEPTLVMFYSDN